MDINPLHNGQEQNSEVELRLWEYIDGISEEPSVIEQLIAENAEWRAKYAELLEVHQLVQSADLEQPSMRFTRDVMDEIARLQITPAAKEYINQKIIWGIAAFFITAIVGFLVYGLSQIEWSTGSGSQSPVSIDFSNVDYSRMFNNTFVNLFMMINVVLGLMLLDRFLNMKRKRLMEGRQA
jgi:preprotein translocase subunit Sss1